MNSSTTVETPAGPFTIVVGPSGAVRGAGFTSDVAAVLAGIHPSLRGPVRGHRELGGVTDAVRAYFDGEL
ncbi:MAG: methylated-DNA--protein-cysteine methyltransferase, partial [Actinobacteria bacterium]